MNKRVVVAMSGGVDSSLAAFFLKERGYEVIGATMCIGASDREDTASGRCCGPSDIEDARRVALQLGIPFYVFHLRDDFERDIIRYFCDEYRLGRTPNPCILCNEKLKFGSFLKKAMDLGAEFVATGHYARLDRDDETGRLQLKKGVDRKKDQSYVLFSLAAGQLQRVLFPLGEYRKEEVREKAFQIGLRVHDKPESQEICFIRDPSYHSFLKERLAGTFEPGPILDRNGTILGRHRGIPFYTIGQRRGLGLAKGRPLYVIGIESVKNTITVGEAKEVYDDAFLVGSVNWLDGKEPKSPRSAQVKIRYNHPGAEALLIPEREGIEVRFERPQKAITPGQAAVFYDGEVVLGGGWIRHIIPNPA